MARTLLLPAALLIHLALAPAAHAQATGTLTITARVESTVALTIVAPASSRTGTAAVSVAATGSLPASSTIELRLVAANVQSRDPGFAEVALARADGVSWRVDGDELARSAITIRAPDRWNPSYVCEITITGKPNGPSTDTLRLTAVSN